MLNDISFMFVVQFNDASFKNKIYIMDMLKKRYFINISIENKFKNNYCKCCKV